MLKRLTAEGRFESGLDGLVAGKTYAFTAVQFPGTSFVGLGVAVANEPGYLPVPLTWCHGDSHHTMSAHADELNAALGLSADAVARIVCSSMVADRMRGVA